MDFATASNATRSAAAPKVLLFVDDDPDFLALMEIYLNESLPSVEMLHAPSGEAALETLRTRHVDMILSDFRMPRMDGIEFLAHARESHGNIPLVLFTTYPDTDLLRRAREEAGVQEFYSKDLPPEALVRKIEAALFEHAEQSPHA
ncbi:MAG: response regulator [Euryarchaeota archaeon]|nr:response regulator [Euryarchaeota archaeon]